MRVVNTRKETITEYNLSAGYLQKEVIVKPDAVRIGAEVTIEKDGKTITKKKLCYEAEDLEEVQMYIPYHKPNATPGKLDVIEAQVTYTAMMTDTLLEV